MFVYLNIKLSIYGCHILQFLSINALTVRIELVKLVLLELVAVERISCLI
jgi:hypothetical protein